MNDIERYIGKPVSGCRILIINFQRVEEWVQGKLVEVNDDGTIVIEQFLTFSQYLKKESNLPSVLRDFRISEFKSDTFKGVL